MTQLAIFTIFTLLNFYNKAPLLFENGNKPTVILIDATPVLVDLNEEGEILNIYGPVLSYFTSDVRHEDFVALSLNYFNSMNRESSSFAKFIPFDEHEKLLDESEIESLREIAVVAETDPLAQIIIIVPVIKQYEIGRRLRQITSVLQGFGISQDKIEIVFKEYTGSEDMRFFKVEVEYLKFSNHN